MCLFNMGLCLFVLTTNNKYSSYHTLLVEKATAPLTEIWQNSSEKLELILCLLGKRKMYLWRSSNNVIKIIFLMLAFSIKTTVLGTRKGLPSRYTIPSTDGSKQFEIYISICVILCSADIFNFR